ncbi:MAG: EAL domain-containing protein [Ketobacteraceae bacterium]|nr:EAL domain-containing protein [Ketobacteraceae bacterium]
MGKSGLNTLLLNREDSASTQYKLKTIVSVLRKQLDMDVAFISEFLDGKRIFRFVDSENEESPVKVGGSDSLEETYCKRIADGDLGCIIHDATLNEITRKLDITRRLSIGSYMGIPLVLSNGQIYGSFCCFQSIADPSLSKRDLGFLRAIAEIASELIEEKLAHETSWLEVTKKIGVILESGDIDIHYQPIYDFHANKVSGFESLSRFVSDPYRTPDIWFSEAAEVGLCEQLEMLAIKNAVSGMNELRDDLCITLNVSPEYVLNGALEATLNNTESKRIILEITEHSPISDYPSFRQALKPLRDQGVRLAIDDAGAGYSSFQHILELEADIIKLDISLTKDIHLDSKKFLLAKALCAYAKAINCIVIAEGIEAIEDLNALRKLGVDKAQGYLIGRPMPLAEAVSYIQIKAFDLD